MYGTLSVANNTRKAISVYIDGEPLFPDILPGEHTEKKPVPAGTRCAQILNSREKIVADLCFSVPKGMHVVLKASGTNVI